MTAYISISQARPPEVIFVVFKFPITLAVVPLGSYINTYVPVLVQDKQERKGQVMKSYTYKLLEFRSRSHSRTVQLGPFKL